MIRKVNSLLFLLFVCQSINAQLSDLDKIFGDYRKSVVRVEIQRIPGKDNNVCTGFVWKDTEHVVTSLHAMSNAPESEIWVYYLDKLPRQAKVVRVLKRADLVLLEIVPDKKGNIIIPEGVKPLNAINSQPIAVDNKIYALGYNHGAPQSSSRSLVKAYTSPPENLQALPYEDQDKLKKVGFPTLDLEILYADGNLLPGYSGSPIFDANGKLVGIGDGGLKKGQASVSWCIPAKYLTELENSSLTTLPAGLASSDQHFTSSVPNRASSQSNSSTEHDNNSQIVIDEQKNINNDKTDTSSDQTENQVEESEIINYDDYKPIESEDFEFYITQNSSLDDIAETSDDPDNLYRFANDLNNNKVTLDYKNLRFDIYEDINYGVIIAVPEGDEVYFSEEDSIFQVDYDENPDVDLYFTGVAGDFSESDFNEELSVMFDWVPPMMAEFWEVENFTIDDSLSYTIDVNENRKIAYILMHSPMVQDSNGDLSNINLYITVLMSKEKSFMAVASYKMQDKNFRIAREQGVDCINGTNNEDFCEYFKSIYKVFCASHLTTFAY